MPTDVVRNNHLVVTVDLDDPQSPLGLTNASTGTELSLTLAAPAFEFGEGLVGGPQQYPVELALESAEGEERVVARYPRQEIGGVTAEVTVVFAVAGSQPVLRKHATLRLEGRTDPSLTLERVTLVDEPLPGQVVFSRDDASGFPVLTDDLFLGVAFPASTAAAADGRVTLSHAPWQQVATGQPYRTREAVVGVCASGAAREAFDDYIRSLRRVP